jgi:hypothetical protein
MTEPYRVAVYAAPGSRAGFKAGSDTAGSALLERAEAWLGRAVDGRPVASEAPVGWTRERVDRLSTEARRYGFHGTLKAPFRLLEERTLIELDEAVARFAATRASVFIPALTLSRLGDFYALTPGSGVDASALYSLADAVVTGFDAFRAPLIEAERQRRRPERLTERQRTLLEAWGYPYVLEEFRFHLTVTDRILPDQQDEVEAVLRDWFAGSLDRDIRVDSLAVFIEPAPGAPFELYSAHALADLSDPTLVRMDPR